MFSKYTDKQIKRALKLYHQTNSVSTTVRILGYPSRNQLYKWIQGESLPPKKRKEPKRITNPPNHPRNPSIDVKIDAIRRCFENGECVRYVSEDIGYSSTIIYKWRDRYLKEGILGLMNNRQLKSSQKSNIVTHTELTETSSQEIDDLKKQMMEMQLEIDILKETINVLKKDPGIDQTALSNKEKAVIIDALKTKYSLPCLLEKMNLSKSSYYYQEKTIFREDKHSSLRVCIKKIFEDNKNRYGYRRIHAMLKREGITISEKIVRRIMHEENLVVKTKKAAKYNSYAGEISPAVQNEIKRNFSAQKPNHKWLTDITEFAIPAGKIYLSPIVDCFDGLLVSWGISLSPDSTLVNTMLDKAISQLSAKEKPIVHSDRGAHYRWPGWIERMDNAGLKRSMSKKGCSPDNSACEGVFGRIKNEMFYNNDWTNTSISDFIEQLEKYLVWYNESRIKKSLGYKSPMEYRRSLGLAC